MFSRANFQRPTIVYPLELTWIIAKNLNKQHVRKSLCPTEMLWVKLIMFFQPERNIKQSINKKGQIRNIYGAEMPRSIISYLLETACVL